MSEISQTIDAAIELLRPAMKQQGYAKSGRTWRRRREDCVQVVDVQASPWNSGEAGSFTVNLGVYFPAVAELVGEPPVQSAPSEMYCQLRERIGFLMPASSDFWWEVRPGLPLLEVADELLAAVSTLGIPWLDSHSSYSAALDARSPATGPHGLQTVALCILLGRAEEASAHLTEQVARLAEMGRTDAVERDLTWGQEHGVVVA